MSNTGERVGDQSGFFPLLILIEKIKRKEVGMLP
jgi:hypothetical protein